jgi:hypothetical protein
MARDHKIGVRRPTIPIPPIEANQVRFPAGSVEFGVEYRHLTDDIVAANHADRPDLAAVVAQARVDGGNEGIAIDDQGVSIHVFDAATGLEWLRFDCFAEDPHYHYITPGSHHVGVGIDEAANGDSLEWTLRAVAERLPEMLREAEASELADRVDQAAVDAVMGDVAAAARASRATV